MKNNTQVFKNDQEKFQIPTEESVKRNELISVLAELILNYSISKKA